MDSNNKIFQFSIRTHLLGILSHNIQHDSFPQFGHTFLKSDILSSIRTYFPQVGHTFLNSDILSSVSSDILCTRAKAINTFEMINFFKYLLESGEMVLVHEIRTHLIRCLFYTLLYIYSIVYLTNLTCSCIFIVLVYYLCCIKKMSLICTGYRGGNVKIISRSPQNRRHVIL